MLKMESFYLLMYDMIRGDMVSVYWKAIICFNSVFFKTVFIIWVVFLGKLRIKDVIRSWGILTD